MLNRRVVLFATLASSACALPPARPTTVAAAPSPTFITSEELRATGRSNLYDAITLARPTFFATRGATSILIEPASMVVIENRMIRGGVEQLRDVDARIVRSVRRLSAADVYQITGKATSSGGIEVLLGP
jgi:hypothetical protein